MKAKYARSGDGGHYGVSFFCPGCDERHVVPTLPHPKGWSFNDDLARPTLSPSILVYPRDVLLGDGSIGRTARCHSYVRDGAIQFLADSTHALSGKTVELPDVEESPS